MSISSAWSPTIRFNRAFSFSNAFSRTTSWGRVPSDARTATPDQVDDAEGERASNDNDERERGASSPPAALTLTRLLDQRLRIDRDLDSVLDPGDARRD